MEENTQNLVDELVEQKTALEESINMDILAEGVRNNYFDFTFNGSEYRVKNGNYKERNEARQYKSKKMNEFIRTKEYLFESELKKKYKDVGVDIAKMESEIKYAQKEVGDLQVNIGKMLANPDVKEEDFKPIKVKVEEIISVITNKTAELSSYMEFSAESQLKIEFYNYLGFLTTLKKNESGEYVKAFSNLNEFFEIEESMAIQIIYFVSTLLSGNEG